MVNIGDIDLKSGQLVVGDPSIGKQLPYAELVTPGTYPVQLAIAQTANRYFNAFIKIQFTNHDIEYWKLALRPGQSLSKLDATQFYGVVVNTEKLILMDLAEYKQLQSKAALTKELLERIDKKFNLITGYSTVEFNFADPVKNAYIIVVSPGTGNGIYAAYVAYDDQNKPVSFLLDFYIVPWANP